MNFEDTIHKACSGSKLRIIPLTTFIEHKLLDKSWLRAEHVQRYLILMMLRGRQEAQRGEMV